MQYLHLHKIRIIFLIFIFSSLSFPQSIKVIQSDEFHAIVEVNFDGKYSFKDSLIDGKTFTLISGAEYSARKTGEPLLPEFYLTFGIPPNSDPLITVIAKNEISYQNKFIVPTPDINPDGFDLNINNFNKEIYSKNSFFPSTNIILPSSYVVRYARVQPVSISPFRYNPITHELNFIKEIRFEIIYNAGRPTEFTVINDNFSNDVIKNTVVNYDVAKKWIAKGSNNSDQPFEQYWYNPNKDYYKIYLKEEGVYKVTFNELVNAGVPLGNGVPSNKIELINNGVQVPLDVIDNGDSIFDSGDYFRFVGFPPTPTIYCTQNIYNNYNVYWFSYQADSSGLRYKPKDGYPTVWQTTVTGSIVKEHYEKDEIYEPLGYAPDDKRDFWFWGKASGRGGVPDKIFIEVFRNFISYDIQRPYVRFRAGLHGMTNPSIFCNYDHVIRFDINNKKIGFAQWNDQKEYLYETSFYVGPDSINIYPGGNLISVIADGNVCGQDSIKSDEIRVNWFEFEYDRTNAVDTNFIYLLTKPYLLGLIKYWIYYYPYNTINIYNPVKGEKIINVQFEPSYGGSVLFIDSTLAQTKYYCFADEHFHTVDSIFKNINSNIRDTTSGADLIIITHSKFASIANRYANLRQINFLDTSIVNPRIKIVDVQNIYDEFNYGLLSPSSIRAFIQYAFEHYLPPAPKYITLIGDMSHDYRHILTSSRMNYIPSMPYMSNTYGQAPSDNNFVAIAGEDLVPDLVIGRISIETEQEGNTYLDKIESYPQDNSKKWKDKILLMASGADAGDENLFGFNDASLFLNNLYLAPNGFDNKMIFRYPNKPSHIPHKGSTLDIRKAFDDGCVIANYYGHGGGYQWDLTFLNNDIYLLNNTGRYPLILSVTCYTAHFDNQDVFGEQFIKVPNKGALGFVGSSGLTSWPVGVAINQLIFDEIFTKKNYLSGSAFFNSKFRIGNLSGQYGDQVALLTFLGDPLIKVALPEAPDFSVKSSDIKIEPENPIVGEITNISVDFNNYGFLSSHDSVSIEILFSSIDTSGIIEKRNIKNFGNISNFVTSWLPKKNGLYQITAKINLGNPSIPEIDYSDNSASTSIAVYNISNPNIIAPADGNVFALNQVEIKISDIGEYINRNLEYHIEIDTSLYFMNPIISPKLLPANGIVSWKPNGLNDGEYFWRTRIFDGTNFGKWSDTRGFSVGSTNIGGFNSSKKLLQFFDLDNINFSKSTMELSLNTDLLPPKPMYQTLLDSVLLEYPGIDSLKSSCITTDGTYLYLANLYYYMETLDSLKRTQIFKIGTGFNGTIKGQYYGTIPNFYHMIKSSLFYHSDGFLYSTTGLPNKLLKINPNSSINNIDSIDIGYKLIEYDSAKVKNGQIYACSDGQYVYNLAVSDSLGRPRYTLRVLDPSQNWKLIGNYYYNNIEVRPSTSSFFIADGNLYTFEPYFSGWMTKVRISDGFFYPEWFTWAEDGSHPKLRFYAWNYDWINNRVNATSLIKQDSMDRKIMVFKGRYVDAKGTIFTQEIGPAKMWDSLAYSIQNANSTNYYSVNLFGLNSSSKSWDTLYTNLANNLRIDSINASVYNYLKVGIEFVDSSFNATNPLTLKSLNLFYEEPPELIVTKNDLTFSPDSLMQGFKIGMNLNIANVGKSAADSIKVKFMLDGSDSVFYEKSLYLDKFSSTNISDSIDTSPFVFDHKVKALVDYQGIELFKFNNLTSKTFYVSRDSINPYVKITFDDKEIINGDIVSKTPEVKIYLYDNSPLPLDTSFFTLVFDNVPMGFQKNKLEYSYVSYPNSHMQIIWKPTLFKGKHTLDILAKDASGNFFDTTFYRVIFNVFEENDLVNVYNYPNPFTDDTYFTFELRGKQKPDNIHFRIFTVAGRLIREIDVPFNEYQIGFNKIYWDGKDQDGDQVANGLYFYKIIVKFPDKTKIETKKLVKLK